MNRTIRTTRSILSIASLAALTSAVLPATARAQRDRDGDRMRIDSTFAFNKGGAVDLSLMSGEIVITAWTRSDAKVYASIENGWIDASLSANRVTLQTRSARGREGSARYEITVPVGTRIEANAVSGSIRISGTGGEVDAGTVSGMIDVTDATDRITLHTVNGRIHAARLRGRTRLSNTSNSIDADDIVGDVNAGTVSGRISLTGVKASHVSAETVSGNVTYAGSIDPAGSYEFSTHSGNVRMEIPENAGADLELETFNGHITSAFPITLQPGDLSSMARRHGQKMEFSIGKGGARVSASTFNGNITIERAGHSDKDNQE
jgi:Putative adhesin